MPALDSSRWQIVIVNYQTGELAALAARSARAVLGASGAVTVVDSASGDDSVSVLRAVDEIDVSALDSNRGFGAALNAGARLADSEFILCTNADAIFQADLLERFETRFREQARLGIMGPRLLSADGSAQPSARRFPTHASLFWSRRSPLRRWFGAKSRSYILPEPSSFTLCDVVAGACFAVRRTLWKELDGMDEEFFLYLEDTDFCLRAKRAGWLVGYDPSVRTEHIWGASTRRNPEEASRRHVESLLYYFRKHHPRRVVANRLLAFALRAGRTRVFRGKRLIPR